MWTEPWEAMLEARKPGIWRRSEGRKKVPRFKASQSRVDSLPARAVCLTTGMHYMYRLLVSESRSESSNPAVLPRFLVHLRDAHISVMC